MNACVPRRRNTRRHYTATGTETIQVALEEWDEKSVSPHGDVQSRTKVDSIYV